MQDQDNKHLWVLWTVGAVFTSGLLLGMQEDPTLWEVVLVAGGCYVVWPFVLGYVLGRILLVP